MDPVAVIGAGISGLSAAFRLQKSGHEVVVFEAEDRVGGVIRSERSGGFLVEHGPNSIQRERGALDDIVRTLGLEERKVRADVAARNRFIVRNGRPQPAPSSPLQLATSDLFGSGAKLRILREPFVPPGHPEKEESVAQFIRRRLGDEILNYGLNPFVAGVYAGDPERLSMRHAFPSIYKMEQDSGSIIKGQIDKHRGAASAAETHRMYSFDDGLEELPRALGRALSGAIRTNTPARKVIWNGSHWMVNDQSFNSVVCAAPLHRLSDVHLSAPSDETEIKSDISLLADVVYPPLSIVAFGFRREDIRHPLDGFGMLVPEVERAFRILGTLFTSSIFPRRAPEGYVLLTSFVGGMRTPDLAAQPSEVLYEIVKDDLDRLLGIEGSPVFRRHILWENSIPQYNLGYGDVVSAMNRLEAALPGLFLAGNYREGISVADAVASGSRAAQNCLDYVLRGHRRAGS